MLKITLLALACTVCLAIARPEEKYTDKYDNINVDEILGNKRLLDKYVQCSLGKGKCTPEGSELKSHISDALETDCSKCTEVQKKQTRKIIKHLINHEPKHWNDLVAKYDPSHKYVTKYESELRSVTA